MQLMFSMVLMSIILNLRVTEALVFQSDDKVSSLNADV